MVVIEKEKKKKAHLERDLNPRHHDIMSGAPTNRVSETAAVTGRE